MSVLTPTQIADFNRNWRRILRLLGLYSNQGLGTVMATGGGAPPAPGGGGLMASTADTDIYVDTATGSDENDGSEASPYKTITKAIQDIPFLVSHLYNVYVAAGTYTENLSLNVILSGNGSINFYGAEGVAPTLASGITTGLVTSSVVDDTSQVVTIDNAGWTVDNLRGFFLDDGWSSTPIVKNTATTITLPNSFEISQGTEVKIYEFPTKIIGIHKIVGLSDDINGCYVKFEQFTFAPNPADFASHAAFDVANIGFYLNECKVAVAGTKSGVKLTSRGDVSFDYCYFDTPSGTAIEDYGSGILYSFGNDFVRTNCSYSAFYTNVGISLKDGGIELASCNLRCNTAVSAQGGGVAMAKVTNASISGKTAQTGSAFIAISGQLNLGIENSLVTSFDRILNLQQGDQAVPGNFNATIRSSSLTDSKWGIDLGLTSNNRVRVLMSTVSGIVNTAVNLGGYDKRACYNFVVTDSTTTFATNGKDFDLTGASGGTTVAQLRAASGKTMVDANLFNRMASE